MLEEIKNAKPEEMGDILRMVRHRYRELFPPWELVIVSIEKNEDKNQQLDSIIAFLEHMKQK